MEKTPQVIYDFNPYNIPEEYHQAIGCVTLCASQTEGIMGDFISSLLNIDEMENIALTTHMNNPLMDQIGRALIELNSGTTNIIDKVDDLLDAIKEACLLYTSPSPRDS